MALVGRRAGHRVSAGAGARLTRIGLGACVVVIAGRPVRRGRVGAAHRRVARSRRMALVQRRARDRVTAGADAGLAGIGLRADVIVIAGRPVRHDRVGTPRRGVTRPCRVTLVQRRARQRVAADTQAHLARVVLGAGVAVVTCRPVRLPSAEVRHWREGDAAERLVSALGQIDQKRERPAGDRTSAAAAIGERVQRAHVVARGAAGQIQGHRAASDAARDAVQFIGPAAARESCRRNEPFVVPTAAVEAVLLQAVGAIGPIQRVGVGKEEAVRRTGRWEGAEARRPRRQPAEATDRGRSRRVEFSIEDAQRFRVRRIDWYRRRVSEGADIACPAIRAGNPEDGSIRTRHRSRFVGAGEIGQRRTGIDVGGIVDARHRARHAGSAGPRQARGSDRCVIAREHKVVAVARAGQLPLGPGRTGSDQCMLARHVACRHGDRVHQSRRAAGDRVFVEVHGRADLAQRGRRVAAANAVDDDVAAGEARRRRQSRSDGHAGRWGRRVGRRLGDGGCLRKRRCLGSGVGWCAGRLTGFPYATRTRVAGLARIAGKRGVTLARAALAGVAGRTGVVVVARSSVELVAERGLRRKAGALLALVARIRIVLVETRPADQAAVRVGGVRAAVRVVARRLASVGCTAQAVVAVRRAAGGARAALTAVVLGAPVRVRVAECPIGLCRVRAPGRRVARPRRMALVQRSAGHGISAGAGAALARFTGRASVQIVAGNTVVRCIGAVHNGRQRDAAEAFRGCRIRDESVGRRGEGNGRIVPAGVAE